MKKEYKKPLIFLMKNEMIEIWPDVKFQSSRDGTLLLAARQLRKNRWQMIRFRSHHHGEAFGVELGWNTIPEMAKPDFLKPNYLDFMGNALGFESYTIGLNLLAAGNEICWNIHTVEELIKDPGILIRPLGFEDAMNIVLPPFNECSIVIREVGIPYLEAHKKYFLQQNEPCANQ
jgi:hypothetical protein